RRAREVARLEAEPARGGDGARELLAETAPDHDPGAVLVAEAHLPHAVRGQAPALHALREEQVLRRLRVAREAQHEPPVLQPEAVWLELASARCGRERRERLRAQTQEG